MGPPLRGEKRSGLSRLLIIMTLLDVKDRLLDGGALEDGLVGDGGASGPRHLRDIRLDLIRMTNVLRVLTAPQSEVDAVLIAHQVLVSARLGHPALVHHQDL